MTEPAFPPPPERPERPAPLRPRRRTRSAREDVGGSSTEETARPDRRLGCVIPLALLGIAFTIGGASIVFDWWTRGGSISSYLLLLCLFAGPGLLWFARVVYRDPEL